MALAGSSWLGFTRVGWLKVGVGQVWLPRFGWLGLGCLGLGWLGLGWLGLIWLELGWLGFVLFGAGWLGLARVVILYNVGQHIWDSNAELFFKLARSERGLFLY